MCSACSNRKNLKVRRHRSPGEEQLRFVVAFHTRPRFCEMWVIFLTQARDHTSPTTGFDEIFCFPFILFGSSWRLWIYLKSLLVFFFCSLKKLPSWSEIITMITVAIQRNWIYVIRLWWIMYVSLSLDFFPSLRFMDHLFLALLPQQWTEVPIETLGRRPHLLCPVLQGAAPKLYPSPASTRTSPSEYFTSCQNLVHLEQ